MFIRDNYVIKTLLFYSLIPYISKMAYLNKEILLHS